jgi:hypothetical protein
MTFELDIARPLTATEETILAQLAETFFAEAAEPAQRLTSFSSHEAG